jgi:SSS family solute:Na+ symporter
MTAWALIFGLIYFALLGYASYKTFVRNKSADEFMLAGKNIGSALGVLTFAAALFSSFTFLGMPDFFRIHGIGAWVFLGVSDGAMVFMILWFGHRVRKKTKEFGFKGMSGLISTIYRNKWAGRVLFAGAFIFLVPYAAIQVKGMAMFMSAAFPGVLPFWTWAILTIAVILIYSQIGGFKALVYSDAIQGILLLLTIWSICAGCLWKLGGFSGAIEQIKMVDDKLLSIPGPKGLFNKQFLIISLISIVMIPVTQPQMSTRIVVLKNSGSLHTMAIAVGIFAILVIFPTVFIGFYGAVFYPKVSAQEFLGRALLYDRAGVVGGLAIIGLFACVLSATNAKIFALGSEIRSLLKGEDKQVMIKVKICLVLFAIITFVCAISISDQLALLSKTSFTGTAMMAPMVLMAVLSKRKPGNEIVIFTVIALLTFLLSLAGLIPNQINKLNIELALFIALIIFTILSVVIRQIIQNSKGPDIYNTIKPFDDH